MHKTQEPYAISALSARSACIIPLNPTVAKAKTLSFCLLVTASTVDILSDQMKFLLAAGSISLKINLPLSRLFSFEDSEITCTDCLLYGVTVGHR